MNRTIKIEEIGDYDKGKTYNRIRLKGKWLYEAGFEPGEYVSVTNPKKGVLIIKLNKGDNHVD